MLQCIFLLLCFLILIPSIGIRDGAESMHKEKPVKHVILVTIDTLRTDVLSLYSDQGEPTPNIEKLARDGVFFRNAIASAPWTLPSIVSLFSGVSPLVHLATRPDSVVPDSLKTLAEYMQQAGFRTAAVGKNPFLNRKSLVQGFDEYHFFPKPWIKDSSETHLPKKLLPKELRSDDTSKLTRLAEAWIASNRDQTFFFWLHYHDPHIPYAPPKKYLPLVDPEPRIGVKFSRSNETRSGQFVPSLSERAWIKELYLSEVRYVDEAVGKILKVLRNVGIYDEALIILTSDHGEEFWEHGGYEHGHQVYNELLRVPLIIKLPKFMQKKGIDREIHKWIPVEGILPTVLDISNIEYQREHLSAQSFFSLLKTGVSSSGFEPIVSTGHLYFQNRISLIFGNFKYIKNRVTHKEELYDLLQDPGEKDSLAESLPQKLLEARSILMDLESKAQRLKDYYDNNEAQTSPMSSEKVRQLKSLGYLH